MSFNKPKLAVSAWGSCLTEQTGSLKETFRKHLEIFFQIVPLSDKAYDFFLALEHYPVPLAEASGIVIKQNRFLATFEPETVNPLQYRSEVRSQYGEVFVATKLQKVSTSDEVFNSGGLTAKSQLRHNLKNFASNSIRVPNSLGMVNANKFSLSPNSNYSLRRDVVRAFTSSKTSFHLAGHNWTKGFIWEQKKTFYEFYRFIIIGAKVNLGKWRFPLTRSKYLILEGSVKDSVEFLSKLEIAIVIENESNYVTEKLFDAVQAGCVVIYCGPDLSIMDIPTDICLQVPPKPKAFCEAYRRLCDDNDLKDTLRAKSQTWIEEPQTMERWGHDKGLARLANLVIQKASEGI